MDTREKWRRFVWYSLCVYIIKCSPFMQELESDEEWSSLLEITDQELKLQQNGEEIEDPVLERLVESSDYLGKMSAGFNGSADEVLKGILEGASKFRHILKVFRNVLLLPG
jgi:hypothetical protein